MGHCFCVCVCVFIKHLHAPHICLKLFFNHDLQVSMGAKSSSCFYLKSADTSARIFTMEMGFEGPIVTDIGSKAV